MCACVKAVQLRHEKKTRAKAATKVQGLFRQREAKLEIARIKEKQTKKQIMLEEFKGTRARVVMFLLLFAFLLYFIAAARLARLPRVPQRCCRCTRASNPRFLADAQVPMAGTSTFRSSQCRVTVCCSKLLQS